MNDPDLRRAKQHAITHLRHVAEILDEVLDSSSPDISTLIAELKVIDALDTLKETNVHQPA